MGWSSKQEPSESLGASVFGGFFFGAMTVHRLTVNSTVFLKRQTAGLYGSNGLWRGRFKGSDFYGWRNDLFEMIKWFTWLMIT